MNITPLLTSFVRRESLRFPFESQRNAYFDLAEEHYRQLMHDMAASEGGEVTDDLGDIALNETCGWLEDERAAIDEKLAEITEPDGCDTWAYKPYAKSIAYEYLQEFNMSDDEVNALLRMVAEFLARTFVNNSNVPDEDYVYEVSTFSDMIYLGPRVQQEFIDVVDTSEMRAKIAAMSLAAGKEPERVTFERFMSVQCDTLGIDGDLRETIEHDIYVEFIENKELFLSVIVASMKEERVHDEQGRFIPNAYYGELALHTLAQRKA